MAGKIIDYVDSITFSGTNKLSEDGLGFSSAEEFFSYHSYQNAAKNLTIKYLRIYYTQNVS